MDRKLLNRDFLLMLQGELVSGLGDILYSVAIGYWVYDVTGSSALMGILSSISMFVTMFLAPFSGGIVDKANRKAIIVGMDVLRGVLMLGVGVLALTSRLSVPVVAAAALLAALCSTLFGPAVSTVMIDIIPHDDMVRGQSIHSGATTALSLVGKAVSGALVAFLGVPVIIVLNGVSYLISALTEAFIHIPKTVHQGETVTVRGLFRDFGTALKAIAADPFLRICVPSSLAINLLAAGSVAMMLPFVLEKGYDVESYGVLMSVDTAASLACVFLLGIIRFSPRTRFFLLGAGFMLGGAFSIGAYLVAGRGLMCLLLFLGGFGCTLGNSVLNASMVLAIPEGNRGGILGLLQSGAVGGMALSTLAYGFLCDVFPVYLVFTVGALLSAVPMGYLCFSRCTRQFILEN